MYNVAMSKVHKSHNAMNKILQSEPTSAQHNRSILNSEFVAESRMGSVSGNQIVASEISKFRHLSPNLAASTRNQDEKMLTLEPNQDKLFGTTKRFF